MIDLYNSEGGGSNPSLSAKAEKKASHSVVLFLFIALMVGAEEQRGQNFSVLFFVVWRL